MVKRITFILSVLLSLPSIVSAVSDEIAAVKVEGRVEFFDSKKNIWSDLKSGLKLREGSSIRTYSGSSCDIQLNNHLFRLKENSSLELIDLDIEKSIKFKLLSGELLNKLNKLPPDSTYTLETPEAVSGVRGTRFLVKRKEEKGTEVYVAQKAVNVKSIEGEDKSAICAKNQKVVVSPWPWTIYEARGESRLKEEDAVEITEEDYISRFGAKERLENFRIAQLDGYRNLAKKIYGTVIKRDVTLKDYAKDNSIVTEKVEGIVRGAEIKETGFFSNRAISVLLIIKGEAVIGDLRPAVGDIFGKNYLSAPETVRLEDFNQYIELERL